MIAEQKRIDVLLLITAHALILCGLVCVILTGEIPVPLWLLALAAHPASIFMRPKEGRYFFNSIVILAFCYFLFLYFILQSPFLLAFTQFLIVVQAVKLFHLEKAKDYFQLAGLGLLTVLAAAGLTSQFYYLFMLLILLLFGIWFLFLLHLKRDREQHVSLPHPPRQLTSPSLLFGISGVAFCSFILTILIFFSLPRITLSVSGNERWEGVSSGFSDVVDLTSTGPVRLDNRIVMRVELPQFSQPPPFPLYWRGISFASWNGQTWEKEDILNKFSRAKGVGRLVLHRKRDNAEVVDQIIMIEPLGTDILFCLYPPLEIQGIFPYLHVDKGGGLHLPSSPHGRYYYEVRSAPNPWEHGNGEPADIPDKRYLQLPEGTKEIAELAQEIVLGATSPREKVHRVVAYLQNNYTYSLNPKRNKRFRPMEDFLLHSREGYCEHFATAAALLLREEDVPTRLVCGFLQGEWNALGRYFMVRQRDAHTWIEVYLPGSGWTTFDPTPAGEAKAFSPLVSSLNRYYDFLKLKWNRYIIQYTRRDQLRFFLSVRRHIMGLRLFPHSPSMQGIRDRILLPPYLLAGLAIFVCMLLIFWGFKKRRRPIGSPYKGKLPSEISFYLKMLNILDKKKIAKRESETPAEFAHRISSVGSPLAPWIDRITALYYKVRFGRIPLTPHEEKETGEIIRDLRKGFSSPSASVKS